MLNLFQSIRKKAQDSQAQNVNPHLLSRGGYKKLEATMMEEKLKARRAAISSDADSSLIPPPSPPARHDKWKQARTRRSGAFTSDATRGVAERIVSYDTYF